MKLKIALIFILIISITVLTFGAVVNADEYIIKPVKVNYYDSIYSATPGGSSFFDPNKKYNSFFSPYATSEVNIKSTISFTGSFRFTWDYISGILTPSQEQYLLNDIGSYFYLIDHIGSGSYQFNIEAYFIKFYYDINQFVVEFKVSYDSMISVKSGTLGFYYVSDYDIWGPRFSIGYSQYTDSYSFINGIKATKYSVRRLEMKSNYVLPIICTSNNLVFLYSCSFSGVHGPFTNASFDSYLFLNNVQIDYRKTPSKIGGVYDLHFDNSIYNQNISIFLFSNDAIWSDVIGSDNFEEYILTFEFGTLIPYSEDVGYSGGQNYGSWSSNSCDWYDIPCHLGNALGYFVYEFPLTKPITTLFTGLVGYLDAFFDIFSEFSGVEVIFEVLITMIVVGIVVALFKG